MLSAALALVASTSTEAFQGPDSPCAEAIKVTLDPDGKVEKPARVVDLEKRVERAPADKALARELAGELFGMAEYMMYCSPAPPRQKYPAAYCLYGRVLELDETNEKARDSRKIIVDIYESLGKDVPTCPGR